MGTIEDFEPELPSDAQERLTLAYDFMAQEKPQEALQACQTVIEIAPEFGEAYNLKGILLEQLGDQHGAVEAYQRATQLAPDFEDARLNLSELQNELLEAQRRGRKTHIGKGASWNVTGASIPEPPAEAQEQLDLANALRDQGKLQEALQVCEETITLVPESAVAYNLKGILLEEMGKSQEAVEAYQRAIELAPDFEDARLNMLELQDEMLEPQYRDDKTPAWKVALQGAVVFGGLFAMFGGLNMFVMGHLGLLFFVAVETMGYALSCGLGIYVIGASSKFRETVRLSLFGAVGCAGAYGVMTCLSFVMTWGFEIKLPLTLQYVVIGIITGVALGVVQKRPQQLKLSIGAGLVGFGIFALLSEFFSGILLNIFPIPWSADPTKMWSALALPAAIKSGIMGVMVGAAFGWVVAQNPVKNLHITDES
ncbi:MAG: tetratricopeptide repeat protein [Anaerolineae bacterium]|nr:tetratricopeptide repeat protein [Anaerolineae bacterium]